MSIIVCFFVSIFASYLITNNKNLQTDTIDNIAINITNIIDSYDGDGDGDDSSSSPIPPFLIDPGQLTKRIVGSTLDPKYCLLSLLHFSWSAINFRNLSIKRIQ